MIAAINTAATAIPINIPFFISLPACPRQALLFTSMLLPRAGHRKDTLTAASVHIFAYYNTAPDKVHS